MTNLFDNEPNTIIVAGYLADFNPAFRRAEEKLEAYLNSHGVMHMMGLENTKAHDQVVDLCAMAEADFEKATYALFN